MLASRIAHEDAAKGLYSPNQTMTRGRMTTQYCSVRALTFASLSLGAVALATLTLGMSTDFWIHTYEVITPQIGNVTYEDYKTTLTMHMGLWRMCIILNASSRTCKLIAYFSQEPGRIDQAEISMSISRATRFAAPFPVFALALILFAFIFGVIGGIKRTCKAVVAAILYIISGLSIAVGIILYISAINDEVSYGQRVKADGDEFRYLYGWSFYLTAGAFMSAEMAAVMCISFYVQVNSSKRNMLRVIPGLEHKYKRWSLAEEGEKRRQSRTSEPEPLPQSSSTLIL